MRLDATISTEPRLIPNLKQHLPSQRLALWLGILILVYLCLLLIAPFLPAIAWAFALALIVAPLERRFRVMLPNDNVRSAILVLISCLALVLPCIFLVSVLVREIAQATATLASPASLTKVREMLEHWTLIAPMLRWVDSQIDVPKDIAQAARAVLSWVYNLTSSLVSGSAWVITQLASMVLLTFYFIRDGQPILRTLRALLPWSEGDLDRVFHNVADTIRVSLYGKLVVAAIQGLLAGLMFWCLGLPAPAFWGFIMGLFSVLPVLGAFVIWIPAAILLAAQGLWVKALVLAGWGLLIVHPVDNVLGPILVGSKLRLHTLAMFFSILGGIAAFGASGIVLGPIILAIAVAVFNIHQHRAALETRA